MKLLALPFTILVLVIPAVLAPITAHAQSTWTTLRAHTIRADFPFPNDFEADWAIALYDTNGNCRIDSYAAAEDPFTPFPFTVTLTEGVTIGQHIGSPLSFHPDGNLVLTPEPGLCGHILIYAEMLDGPTTYFMWFAFPDPSKPVPQGYDNAAWGLDFGFGTYSGNSDARLAHSVHHATFVRDHYASNGTSTDFTGADPALLTFVGTDGTLASPGHVFSADPDPTRPWPAAWGDFVAGTLASDPFLAHFVGQTGVVVDVPLVAEEHWDGITLFPGIQGIGRTITALGTAERVEVNYPSGPPMPSTRSMLGDYNGDGRTDIALWRAGWQSTPIYFSTGSQFDVTNVGHAAWRNWINDPAAMRRTGDFNGDGKTDILMWRSGWATTPVYFSTGTGAFSVTNAAEASGANLMNDPATGKLFGDFDGDQRTDIALWRTGWNSTPIYFSNGDGTFRWTNYLNPSGRNWINEPGGRRIVGDFNADGKADILLSRDGWGSTPVYFSTGHGWFNVPNIATNPARNWINDLAASPMVGDFNGDGRTDVALAKAGWNSTPIFFSTGGGGFTATNYLTSSAELNDPLAQRIVGDFNGDGRSDVLVARRGYTTTPIYLSSGAGWFSRTTQVTSGNYLNAEHSLALAGDFNRDGRTDIAMRGEGWPFTPVFLSTAGATLAVAYDVHHSAQNWINQ